jgi:hypothetical protein
MEVLAFEATREGLGVRSSLGPGLGENPEISVNNPGWAVWLIYDEMEAFWEAFCPVFSDITHPRGTVFPQASTNLRLVRAWSHTIYK